MPRILFLDDDLRRTNNFVRMLRYYDTDVTLVTVMSSAECIECLASDWDYVFLDHDLGEANLVRDRGDTGFFVVDWMQEHKPQVGKVIVHSLNACEAPKMVLALQRVGYEAQYVPFTVIASYVQREFSPGE